MIKRWKEFSAFQKAFKVVHVIITVMIVIVAMLQLLDVWTQAIDVLVSLLGVNMLCQTYDQWDKNRRIAYISLGATIVVFISVVAVLVLK